MLLLLLLPCLAPIPHLYRPLIPGLARRDLYLHRPSNFSFLSGAIWAIGAFGFFRP